MRAALTVDGRTLQPADVVAVARADAAEVVLEVDARERLTASREHLESRLMTDDAPLVYAFNTGVDLFKDQRRRAPGSVR